MLAFWLNLSGDFVGVKNVNLVWTQGHNEEKNYAFSNFWKTSQ